MLCNYHTEKLFDIMEIIILVAEIATYLPLLRTSNDLC